MAKYFANTRNKITEWYNSKIMFKTILNLIITRAPKAQWQLNIGALLIKKGTGTQVGDALTAKRINSNQYKVTYVSGFSYDFDKNRVIPRYGVKIVTDEKTR